MITTAHFLGFGWSTPLIAAALLLAAGTSHAEGMMGMHGMGMMGGDGDTKVTKEQFMQNAEKRFAHMDANADGVIDASDRAAMRKRMHDCMGKMDGTGMGSGDKPTGGADASGQADDEHDAEP